jgi:hypothetical protein
MTVWVLVLAVSDLPGGAVRGLTAECRRCGWSPPPAAKPVLVRNVGELKAATKRARPGSTILLADGVYQLDEVIGLTARGMVLRSRSGDRRKVILRGEGMAERKIGVGLSITAPDVVVADLTVGYVRLHAIQVHGETGARRAVIHNVVVLDAGQQLLKASVNLVGEVPSEQGESSDDGLVACSTFAYSDSAPSGYTNGIDILGARRWTIRDNYLLRIRGPNGRVCGPAIMFYKCCEDPVVERNVIVDCSRGIGLGLVDEGQSGRTDNKGGVVRNNILCNLNSWADEGIEVNDSPGSVIEHNTVLVEGRMPWSISVRFPASKGVIIRNNLSNRPIGLRDGAQAERIGNVTDARRTWFTDPSRGILRLARGDLPAIDAGVPLTERRRNDPIFLDFDFNLRPQGKAPDAGAFEYQPPSASDVDPQPSP